MIVKELKTKVKLKMPSVLDAHQAEDFHKTMVTALSAEKNVEIDASEVEKIDTLCSQILLASKCDCQNKDIQLDIKDPTKKMEDTFKLLGLTEKLLETKA